MTGNLAMEHAMKLEEKYVKSVYIKPDKGKKLREIQKKIENETGVSVKESTIVDFLIDQGHRRLRVRKDGLELI